MQTDRQTDRQKDEQIDRQTRKNLIYDQEQWRRNGDGQTDRQTDRRTEKRPSFEMGTITGQILPTHAAINSPPTV